MKAKTIAKTIDKKVTDWLSTIEDESLRSLCKKDVIVTGGSIVSMFLQEPVNDYDLYFKHSKTVALLANYYAKKMIASDNFKVRPAIKITFENSDFAEVFAVNVEGEDKDSELNYFEDIKEQKLYKAERVEIYVKSQGFSAEGNDEEYKYFESESPEDTEKFFSEISEQKSDGEKYRPVFMSSNAITLSNKIQIVLRFTGDPAEIHKNYDFVHATNYWTFSTGLVTNTAALESILSKELIYRGSLYPLASIFRTRKFIQRDWTCHVGNYLKMALQLNELDLFDINVLREQLTGVDAAYLHEVITAVKEQQNDNPDFKFNSAYLCQIIDRMMGIRDDKTLGEE